MSGKRVVTHKGNCHTYGPHLRAIGLIAGAMSSPDEIMTNLRRKFEKHYFDTFLLAPEFIHDKLYINSQLKLNGPTEITLNLNQLCDKVMEGGERSFLILGDSGSGKTSFALKLCRTLWAKSGLDDKVIIPIYVHLPSLVTKLEQNESEFNVVEILVKELGVKGIDECEGQIVFILDSYDEISSFSQRLNIVKNIWMNTSSFLSPWLSDVTILTCSRPDAVPKSESMRQEMFGFLTVSDHKANGKYSEYSLEALSGDSISNFLETMENDVIPQLKNCRDEDLIRWSAWGTLKCNLQDWKSGDYREWFMEFPDLIKLSENPYILTLICQTLPGIVLKLKNEEKELKRLCETRVGIISSFTEQVFEYQAKRVSLRPDNLRPDTRNISRKEWCIYFKAYAQNLAGRMLNFTNDESVDKMSDQETLDPSLIEPVLNIEQLKKLETKHKYLFPPRLTHYEEGTLANATPIQIQNMKILRDACSGSILVYSANEDKYKFIHRTMLEYFASQQAFESSLAVYDLVVSENLDDTSVIYGKTGFGRALLKDRDILSQLVERMSFEYKKILFKLIRASKDHSELHRISANAITILNKALVCFSGQDYRDIQIQGADLRQSICANTDFRGANLTGVQFGDSYLVEAQFQGACMVDTDLGEFPFLILSNDLNSIVIYRVQGCEEDNWVIATQDGAVRIWNTLEENLVIPASRDSRDIIYTCLSMLDGKVAVWTDSVEISQCPLSTTMVTYEVCLYDLFPKLKYLKKHTLQTTGGVVHIQIRSLDKCVLIFSASHLEVIAYLPTTTQSDTERFVTLEGEDSNMIFTFTSTVDKNGRILVACYENCAGNKNGRIVVYEYNEGFNHFQPVHRLSKKLYSGYMIGMFNIHQFDRILFKPDGSGLAIYDSFRTNLQIFENYSKIIKPVNSDLLFMNFAFDKAGKYLAASTLDTQAVMIWNIPSGTIHRQFGSSTIPFPSRFSNPLAFSSDSKILTLGGSRIEGNKRTMILKLIDENPSVSEFSTPIAVGDLAVSEDGQIVVIVRKVFPSRDYIEIFSFPFQNTTGLCVCFHEEDAKHFVAHSIGIANSKENRNLKKIIAIQEENCQTIVICSQTGRILQNFRFNKLLKFESDTLSCVNKQASFCCIYSPTQGYFFWEISENNDFEIMFQRKIELELLIETNYKVDRLRFDITGRYLQLFSPPLLLRIEQELKFSKIVLVDLKKSVCIIVNTNFLIRSVDTDMTNNTIFVCDDSQLCIYNRLDGTVQQVDYNFVYCLELYSDPLSGWLFATCVKDYRLVILHKKESQWRLALEIPLWFAVEKCVIYEKNNKLSVFAGGQSNLCYIEFDKDDCKSWRLLWSLKPCYKLKTWESNIDRTLGLSKRNGEVLKGLGTMGTAHKNIKSKYLPFSDWCQEIFGTARSEFPFPFIKIAGNNFLLSDDVWIISLVGNLSHILKWRAHVYFIVEGIKNNRRFITRIHLIYAKDLKEVSIVVSPVVDKTHVTDHAWEESEYIEFIHSADKLSAQQYSMSREDCEQFLRNIQSDMHVKLDYNLLTDNCVVWCERHLKEFGFEVHLEAFTTALIFPRVLELFKKMTNW